ncbi:alanine racemase [Rhizocola hellebori]|uniref:Alanine racemase n=1 Tax=Rhizocola hellebori TaxID=1392758 RepID=A0A8J3Q4J3_9ACTN|nr:amino acid deaminase/aldolase [Rhizocola hellebori]GIH03304.1 alanine racemase [Rhizocola hellebori]
MKLRHDSRYDPIGYWSRLDSATSHLDPVFAVLDLDALSYNAFDMVRRAGGKPIRIATKSVRCRAVIEAALAVPGYRGVLAYTLAEALWLAETLDDVVVGYPSTDRSAYRKLATSEQLAKRVTVMVDSPGQLDLIDAAVSPHEREPIRVCIELDSSWASRPLGHIGVWRSPVHTPQQARNLARTIVGRPGFRLVGVMGYEAQVAGLGNAPAGKPLRGMLVRRIQQASMAELRERRALAVKAVAELAELEFVNGGGTGSIEVTAADRSVTEIAAGSGLFGPHLFDNYRHFKPAPAAAFALPVVRRPAPDRVTLLGGGWIASGPPGADRLPQIVWPQGLRMVPREMAGEVQTPVVGAAARQLRIGDRVWARHTKSGELSEHTNELHVVDGDAVVSSVPTYRGEGKAFL